MLCGLETKSHQRLKGNILCLEEVLVLFLMLRVSDGGSVGELGAISFLFITFYQGQCNNGNFTDNCPNI